MTHSTGHYRPPRDPSRPVSVHVTATQRLWVLSVGPTVSPTSQPASLAAPNQWVETLILSLKKKNIVMMFAKHTDCPQQSLPTETKSYSPSCLCARTWPAVCVYPLTLRMQWHYQESAPVQAVSRPFSPSCVWSVCAAWLELWPRLHLSSFWLGNV